MVKPRRVLSPQSVFDHAALLAFFEENDIKPRHATSLIGRLIRGRDTSFVDVPDLPKKCYELMPSHFAVTTSKLIQARTSSDGTTTKMLVRLQDDKDVEAVIMRHDQRSTLCVSSQVGCAMGCTFCATGTMNLLANLTTGEILEQLYLANRIEPITNVVFMGMGEPLDNYDAVVRAINCMTDEAWFGLSKNKVTLSTVGVAPRMEQLAREAPHVNLALSLHAPSQELRASIMPAARAFPLPRLLAAMDYHIAHCSRHVLVQYVLLGGVNDSDEAAHELGALLKGRNVILNLIPYNPTNVGIEFKTPTEQEVEGFQKKCQGYGVHVTVRKEMGQDVDAACGQLAVGARRLRNQNVPDGAGPLCGGDGSGKSTDASPASTSGAEGAARSSGATTEAAVDDIEELFRVGKQRARRKQAPRALRKHDKQAVGKHARKGQHAGMNMLQFVAALGPPALRWWHCVLLLLLPVIVAYCVR